MSNLWMLQLGVKMLLGTNVTVDHMFSGHSMKVKMELGRSVVDVPSRYLLSYILYYLNSSIGFKASVIYFSGLS
jgi:hypothetical protein